jgi:hypothetical protein
VNITFNTESNGAPQEVVGRIRNAATERFSTLLRSLFRSAIPLTEALPPVNHAPRHGVVVYPMTKEGSKKDVAEQQGKTPDRPEHERYYSECVRLPANMDSAQIILRGVINERSGRGWRLVSATKEPSDNVVLLVWDTAGPSSGRAEGLLWAPAFTFLNRNLVGS